MLVIILSCIELFNIISNSLSFFGLQCIFPDPCTLFLWWSDELMFILTYLALF